MRPNLFMPLGDPDHIEYSYQYLYHYTSISAFCNMLDTNEFWFGYTKNMNDSTEVVGFLRRIVSRLNEDFPIETSRKAEIVKLIGETEKMAHVYIMSFSKVEDDAAQWERYADNATGVCLKINTSILAKACEENKFWLKEVRYLFDDKSNDDYECNYRQLANYIENGATYNNKSLSLIIFELWLTGVYHKHPSFQSEREVRFIKYIHIEDDIYRFSKTNIVKRMFVFDFKKYGIKIDEIIDEIIIGPRSQQSIDELKMYIESKGYTELSNRIGHSSSPLR